MVVEDELLVAKDITRRLADLGYNTIGVAADGLQAIELAGKLRPDLAIINIQLDGAMDGIEAAVRMHERFRLPVVFLTACLDDTTIERVKISATFGCILKPFQDRELKSCIEIALYKHRANEENSRINHPAAEMQQIVAQAAMRKQQSQVIQTQKMEAISLLAGGMAHDFNNILLAILMQLDLLQRHRNQDPEIQKVLKELEMEAKTATSLIRQLQLFSQRSVLEIKVIDLDELTANLLKMVGRLLGEHITLAFERGNIVTPVEADVDLLEQVLVNLCLNARDAMPDGGRITLSTCVIVLDDHNAAVSPEKRSGQFVCLSVADTGCGMDEATLQHIFEPFFSTKDGGKGTGLGLATVYGIVAHHGGWIDVESQLGRGTTFRIFLPASSKSLQSKVDSGRIAVAKGHETILLVEDDFSVRQMLTQTLKVLGYRTLAASTGKEALAVWQLERQHIDLLFADMDIPEGMTGLELAEKLRSENPRLKVIISSGYRSKFAALDKPAANGIVYLPKPYQISVLSAIVRNCLDRK